jgi:hypothetical protein
MVAPPLFRAVFVRVIVAFFVTPTLTVPKFTITGETISAADTFRVGVGVGVGVGVAVGVGVGAGICVCIGVGI